MLRKADVKYSETCGSELSKQN